MARSTSGSLVTVAKLKQNPGYDDLLKTIEYLMAKRRALQHELQLVCETIQELRQQARRANILKQGKSVSQIGDIQSNPSQGRPQVTAAARHAPSSQNPSYVGLLETIQFLMDDTKVLTQHWSLALRTVPEFLEQVRYACTLGAGVPRSVVKPSTWIGGSWLAPSADILVPAEKLWQAGNAEGALKLVESVLPRHDLTVEDDFHANLLVSAIQRALGDLGQASKCAEDALVIARNADDYMLASKAQFYRGLCFLSQQQYAQARFCFALASHLDGYQEQIEVNSLDVEDICRHLPLHHPGRRLDFTSL
ncbi:MAG: hypothetical protein LQ337_001656 [Flavoplaca oasis]|nr:MAG: hypothetical protein LQ337_001656 [Flavoplaca oasis]